MLSSIIEIQFFREVAAFFLLTAIAWIDIFANAKSGSFPATIVSSDDILCLVITRTCLMYNRRRSCLQLLFINMPIRA